MNDEPRHFLEGGDIHCKMQHQVNCMTLDENNDTDLLLSRTNFYFPGDSFDFGEFTQRLDAECEAPMFAIPIDMEYFSEFQMPNYLEAGYMKKGYQYQEAVEVALTQVAQGDCLNLVHQGKSDQDQIKRISHLPFQSKIQMNGQSEQRLIKKEKAMIEKQCKSSDEPSKVGCWRMKESLPSRTEIDYPEQRSSSPNIDYKDSITMGAEAEQFDLPRTEISDSEREFDGMEGQKMKKVRKTITKQKIVEPNVQKKSAASRNRSFQQPPKRTKRVKPYIGVILDGLEVNKLHNFYRNVMSHIGMSFRQSFWDNHEMIAVIDKLFVNSNQRNFLELFPHLQQKNSSIDKQSNLSTSLIQLRQIAYQRFGLNFNHLPRVAYASKSFLKHEEFVYGCMYFAERSSQQSSRVEYEINLQPPPKIEIFFAKSNLSSRLAALGQPPEAAGSDTYRNMPNSKSTFIMKSPRADNNTPNNASFIRETSSNQLIFYSESQLPQNNPFNHDIPLISLSQNTHNYHPPYFHQKTQHQQGLFQAHITKFEEQSIKKLITSNHNLLSNRVPLAAQNNTFEANKQFQSQIDFSDGFTQQRNFSSPLLHGHHNLTESHRPYHEQNQQLQTNYGLNQNQDNSIMAHHPNNHESSPLLQAKYTPQESIFYMQQQQPQIGEVQGHLQHTNWIQQQTYKDNMGNNYIVLVPASQ